MTTVAHVVGKYLPLTETFIYEYLRHLGPEQSIVAAEELVNGDLFPLDEVILIDGLSTPQRAFDAACARVNGRRPIMSRKYEQALSSHGVDLLHGHFGWSAWTTLPVAHRLGVPIVTTFYGTDVSALARRPKYAEVYRVLFEKGSHFLVEGTHMGGLLTGLGCPEEKIRIQHIGVDLARIRFETRAPHDDGTLNVLMCGRLVEKKGHTYAIDAFARMRRELGVGRLVVIGDGELRPALEAQIRSLGLEDHVEIVGYVDHARFLRESRDASIFLAPSVTDSLGDSEGGAPTVLLEMQAAGMPVVATLHADIPEVVADGVSGVLVPERDVVSLADALIDVASHPERWEPMGRAGRAHVEAGDDIVSQAKRLSAVYEEVAAAMN